MYNTHKHPQHIQHTKHPQDIQHTTTLTTQTNTHNSSSSSSRSQLTHSDPQKVRERRTTTGDSSNDSPKRDGSTKLPIARWACNRTRWLIPWLMAMVDAMIVRAPHPPKTYSSSVGSERHADTHAQHARQGRYKVSQRKHRRRWYAARRRADRMLSGMPQGTATGGEIPSQASD